jgi:hypothetical protein
MKAARSAALMALALTLALFAAAPANAGLLVASAPDCTTGTLTKPFSQWADTNNYVLGPGGSFESGATGWSLSGASVVSGNESFYVRSKDDTKSLRVPNGASALSPTVCVGLDKPSIRFFARNAGSGLLGLGATSTIAVNVQFETSLGLVTELPLGVVTSSSGWQPTLPMVVLQSLLPLLPDNYTPVRFRLSAVGGDWRVDDFYVDPYRRN